MGFKLAGGKGLREGRNSKELWKSVEKATVPNAELARGASAPGSRIMRTRTEFWIRTLGRERLFLTEPIWTPAAEILISEFQQVVDTIGVRRFEALYSFPKRRLISIQFR